MIDSDARISTYDVIESIVIRAIRTGVQRIDQTGDILRRPIECEQTNEIHRARQMPLRKYRATLVRLLGYAHEIIADLHDGLIAADTDR